MTAEAILAFGFLGIYALGLALIGVVFEGARRLIEHHRERARVRTMLRRIRR